MTDEQAGVGTVAVVGLGYIGLPTAAILASKDVKVVGVDVNERTVAAVNRGDVPFVEPELATYVAGAVAHGHLRASCVPEPADAFIIAVPTPFTARRTADLSHVEAAARSIAPHLNGGELVILESTAPPRTTARMAEWILDERPDLSVDGSGGRPVIHVAHCPERVMPGNVMVELMTNDRVVGGLTPRASVRASDLYRIFCRGTIVQTDAVTAEMTKLAENTFRDVNIAFANELAAICEVVGVDARELIALANHHPRVDILQPGPGVGGHCVAVDPWFLIDAAPEAAQLAQRARRINAARPAAVARQLLERVEGTSSPRVVVLGLAFKPNVDDVRESPAVEVVHRIAEHRPDAHVSVVDPHVHDLPPALAALENVELREVSSATAVADLHVLLVNHDALGPAVRVLGRRPTFVDVCGGTPPRRRGHA
ncbi:UDP-N-acetyl-D-mannosaminuronic acid dehydrogenase [Sediminihabitans luteus]|uniref:UDP-N-acetyl-D-mannosaminuronic acid dehydrogenase n=1 Tax=Sediminihabitans luteus TaxID=1138585 RepID=A0A2M9CE88_9CELL|nr:UDP-N-acetyl-D-mannosamine dehydrogenase [Sediminihabitans luteus]PJJ70170.1 UDP-N-acetyl-D-mannosaminuronic acid dehydrogenase [Sediminihabitans luteus]GII97641.1 UDP-N-acetyl-D-mannosamine dehydrogenase [Sediminihabitans luteus]